MYGCMFVCVSVFVIKCHYLLFLRFVNVILKHTFVSQPVHKSVVRPSVGLFDFGLPFGISFCFISTLCVIAFCSLLSTVVDVVVFVVVGLSAYPLE